MQFSTLFGAVAIVAGLVSAAPASEQSAVKRQNWQQCLKAGDRCTNILGGVGGCVCGLKLDPRYDCVCV
ncbi:hypothetical protein HER10_EVM0011838 [Colletotrichum scovillei]|uniref:uncharacterized protein n=1 Tax=Colletotrichum scovillei TaxID=1209932 RepID=UPI0015C3DD3F|nr:uncharacterized protein HER10_EVM0011838 [Colletotrichum scovillei]KAF4777139.1 hypothetical protein HER10_EVM0011838 [Colletotrichum scovillei]